jgi:F0F1-type ATP synthase assembly protein I
MLGGGLYLDSQSLTYKTNKLTVDKKYRNLVLPLQNINNISWKWVVFPILTVEMKGGETYKFIMFNKNKFEECFNDYSKDSRSNDMENNNNNNQEENKTNYMIMFMCLGLSVGMAIGAATSNIPIGMCIGLGVGMCLGSSLDLINRKKENEQKDENEDSSK